MPGVLCASFNTQLIARISCYISKLDKLCAAQVVDRLQGTLPVVIDHATWEETAGERPYIQIIMEL
jgi:hypothetical protein